jgi:ribosome biogenesis GTPase A
LTFRVGASSRTGAKPGVTRKLESLVKILDPTEKCPAVYIVDSPGIMVTKTKDVETSIKLALSGGIKDDITHEGLEWICRYLLWTLNKFEQLQYVKLCGLQGPTDDFEDMITHLARRLGAYGHKGVLDTERAMRWMIREYREGRCGTFMLDELPNQIEDRNGGS